MLFYLPISLPTLMHKQLSLKVNKVSQFWINTSVIIPVISESSWRLGEQKIKRLLKYSFPVAFRDNTNKNEFTQYVITCTKQIKLDNQTLFTLFHLWWPSYLNSSADKRTLAQKLLNDELLEYTSFSLFILCETEPKTKGWLVELYQWLVS